MYFIKFIIRLLRNTEDNILMRFLLKANAAYVKALIECCVEPFVPYADIALIHKLSDKLCDTAELPFLGIDQYRHEQWRLLEQSDDSAIYQKTVTHENIKLTKNFEIPIGDDFRELWYVHRGERPIVIDIGRG